MNSATIPLGEAVVQNGSSIFLTKTIGWKKGIDVIFLSTWWGAMGKPLKEKKENKQREKSALFEEWRFQKRKKKKRESDVFLANASTDWFVGRPTFQSLGKG